MKGKTYITLSRDKTILAHVLYHVINYNMTYEIRKDILCKRGKHIFKNKSPKELEKKTLQIHLRDLLASKYRIDLTKKQMNEVIEIILLLKQKNSGDIKVISVEDGRKQ